MRNWYTINMPLLGLLLSSGLGAVLVGLSAGWTTLFLGKIILAKAPDTFSHENLAAAKRILLLEEEENPVQRRRFEEQDV